jgi:hypothetical protein
MFVVWWIYHAVLIFGSRRERRQGWSCNQHRSTPRAFGGGAE